MNLLKLTLFSALIIHTSATALAVEQGPITPSNADTEMHSKANDPVGTYPTGTAQKNQVKRTAKASHKKLHGNSQDAGPSSVDKD